MMDFPNIPEILDFLLADLGIPDKAMISERSPHVKPFENRNVSPKLKKTVFGEKFLGGNVSGGKGFRSP